MNNRMFGIAAFALLSGFAADAAGLWYPYKMEATQAAFDANPTTQDVDYVPLAKADKKWKICVSLPHMKDAYFLGVDYGLIDEAKRLGVEVSIVEAGGYTNLDKQISQVEDCVTRGAQAVAVVSISTDGLNNLVKGLTAKGVPVIDLVNGMSSRDTAARSLISFYTMAYEEGRVLAARHPAGSAPAKVGFFPGPAGAAWVEAAVKGFAAATKGSALVVLDPKYGDTGKEVQAKLVEDVLQANPDLRYIAGTAVTAEAAVGLLRARGLDKKVSISAFYLTPGAYDGIKSGRIDFAVADSMVIQARVAIDQAVRILEKKDYFKKVSPKPVIVSKSNMNTVNKDAILPPAGFKPIFSVN